MLVSGFRPEELPESLLRAELRQVRDAMERLIDRHRMLAAEFDRRHGNYGATAGAADEPALADLLALDDSALIARRGEIRAELHRNPDAALQRAYDATTREMAARAGKWTGGGDAA